MVYYDGQVVANQVVYAAAGNWLLNKVKTSKIFPFLNESTYLANKLAAMGIAAITAFGINYTYTYAPADGVLNIAITGLTIAGIFEGAKQFMFSYVLQQGMYNGMKWKEQPK
jgi:hypothetical protein